MVCPGPGLLLCKWKTEGCRRIGAMWCDIAWLKLWVRLRDDGSLDLINNVYDHHMNNWVAFRLRTHDIHWERSLHVPWTLTLAVSGQREWHYNIRSTTVKLSLVWIKGNTGSTGFTSGIDSDRTLGSVSWKRSVTSYYKTNNSIPHPFFIILLNSVTEAPTVTTSNSFLTLSTLLTLIHACHYFCNNHPNYVSLSLIPFKLNNVNKSWI